MLINKDDLRLFLPNNGNKHNYVSFVLLALILITLPFFIQLTSGLILLLAGVWLSSGQWHKKFKRLVSEPTIYMPLLLFAVLILSYFLSDDKKTAGFELEKKLSLLAFPLIFTGLPFLNRRIKHVLLSLFVYSCFLAALICLIFAVGNYSFLGSAAFFYHQLSSPLHFHAVYFSAYISFCCILVYLSFKAHYQSTGFAGRLAHVILFFFFLLFLILLSSKSILAATLFIIIILSIRDVFVSKANKQFVAVFLTGLLLSVILVSRIGQVRERFNEILREDYNEIITATDYRHIAFTGGTIRLAIWKTVVEILNEDKSWVLGEGIGDAQNKLTEHYTKKNIYPGDEQLGFQGFIHYNAHNQYFEWLIGTGIAGLSGFLLWIAVLFYKAIKKRQIEVLGFLLLFMFFFLTESALSAHKGIVIFVLIPLLSLSPSENQEEP
jgi:O-antigen ligase